MADSNQGQEKQGNAAGAAQLRDTAQKIGEDLRNMGSQVRDQAHQVKDQAQQKYNELRDQAGQYYEQGKQRAQEWEGTLEDYVREQPVKSLLIAAGVGVLLGVLWKKS